MEDDTATDADDTYSRVNLPQARLPRQRDEPGRPEEVDPCRTGQIGARRSLMMMIAAAMTLPCVWRSWWTMRHELVRLPMPPWRVLLRANRADLAERNGADFSRSSARGAVRVEVRSATSSSAEASASTVWVRVGVMRQPAAMVLPFAEVVPTTLHAEPFRWRVGRSAHGRCLAAVRS